MKLHKQLAKRNRCPWTLLTLFVSLGLASCGSDRPTTAKPMVVTSVTSQAYFVRKIAGDAVDVRVMIPPGANPAAYEPTMDQMRALSKASLYVQIGHPHFPFEKAWLHTLLKDQPNLHIVDCSQGILLDDEDPHIWVSVKNAQIISKNITAALVRIAPNKANVFRQNLARFLQETDRLDREIRSLLAGVQQKSFYVFHPAWHTFAAEYGVIQVAIEHDHKEPSPHELKNIIARAKADGTQTIFVQPQISQTSAELVAREIGGEIAFIDPLGEDWMESMRHAAQSIAKALSK